MVGLTGLHLADMPEHIPGLDEIALLHVAEELLQGLPALQGIHNGLSAQRGCFGCDPYT
jgi:hypothetical protein